MSQLPDARDLLAAAEQAAAAGDLASADELLRNAARVQEDTLGPLHPDLVSTLNNLAIVSEKTGRQSDAETFYRRAFGVACASLPSGHPMVAASRQNLQDFCGAWGVPIEVSPLTASSAPQHSELDAFAPEDASPPADRRADDDDIVPTTTAAQALPDTPLSVARPATAPSQTRPSARGTGSRALTWGTIGVVVLVMAALFAMRPWLPREQPGSTRPAASAARQASEPRQRAPAEPPPAAPPLRQVQAPTGSPGSANREIVADEQRAPTPSAGPIVLAAAELCRTFSTGRGDWRCEPAGDSLASGSIVLYTRLRSRRDGSVTHRWFRGDTLRQSVKLAIRANWTTGYRTYSRQTVDTGEWRVEVRGAGGELLHEQRFAVQ